MKVCSVCGESGDWMPLVKCDYCGKYVCETDPCLETEDVRRNETICKTCYWR